MLYSREPRSSVLPSRRTRVLAWLARYLECAATTSLPSPFISLLSKSKKTMRFANNPVCGPAASSSEPALPALAESEPAPDVSAPLLTSVDCDGPGLGFLLEQP